MENAFYSSDEQKNGFRFYDYNRLKWFEKRKKKKYKRKSKPMSTKTSRFF